MGDKKFRTEKDSMGELQVPVDALYAAQTQRAIDNFPISGQPMPTTFIHALGKVKQACATANNKLGLIDSKIADAIKMAAKSVSEGQYDVQFPIDIFPFLDKIRMSWLYCILATMLLRERCAGK